MRIRALKVIITVQIAVTILATAVVYVGASNLRGKATILLAGLLITISMAILHSWLSLRPITFREWLNR